MLTGVLDELHEYKTAGFLPPVAPKQKKYLVDGKEYSNIFDRGKLRLFNQIAKRYRQTSPPTLKVE